MSDIGILSTQYDVIIVGAGTAGVPAAVSAAQRGLRVALLEAAADIGGTLILSGGSISAAGTTMQTDAGIIDSADDHYRDALRINHGTGDKLLLRKWIDHAPMTMDWLLSHGWTATPAHPVFAPEHDLYTVPRTFRSTEQGFSLIAAYRSAIAEQQAAGHLQLYLNHHVQKILMANGRPCGVVARHDGQDISFTSPNVVLTTGGFNGSDELWEKYHGLVPMRYHIDTVRGDAIRLAEEVGGSVWNANMLLPSFGGTRDLGAPASAWVHTAINPHLRPPWEIYVNQDGERFMAEDDLIIDSRERAIMRQPNWTFTVIYDEAIRLAAPNLFKWDDEKTELLFQGPDEDYVSAETIPELAEKCGISADRLSETIATYNMGQAVGSDMWKRQHMPLPIWQGPFYAVRHYGFSICCYPGVRVNSDLRVVGQDGAPIDGLYAAGEALGIGYLGHSFISGALVSSAVTFGLLIGQSISAD